MTKKNDIFPKYYSRTSLNTLRLGRQKIDYIHIMTLLNACI